MPKTAYKLFRKTKDNRITSLFINKTRNLPIGIWMESENYPTKGFAERQGWHCTAKPVAPHLKMKLKSGEVRVWKAVIIEDYAEFKRPESQGGLWYLAKRMKIMDEEVDVDNVLKMIDVGELDYFQFPKINRTFT